MPLVDYQAFLAGIKPALYGNTNSPTFVKNFDQFKHYPHVTGKQIAMFDGPDFYLFFQSQALKREWVLKSSNVQPRSPHFHYLLGIMLGYPPKAVKYYMERMTDTHLDSFKVSFYYAGLRCIGHIDDLGENAKWLWDHYNVDEPLKIGVSGSYYPVSRYDYDGLDLVKNRCMRLLDALKTKIAQNI